MATVSDGNGTKINHTSTLNRDESARRCGETCSLRRDNCVALRTHAEKKEINYCLGAQAGIGNCVTFKGTFIQLKNA